MTRRQIGLALLATGVALFFIPLFGLADELSLYISVVCVLLMLAGLVTFLGTLQRAALSWPHMAVAVVAVLAIALHVYENSAKRSGAFSFGWLLWGSMPYVLCLVVSTYPATRVAAIAGAIVALLFDLVTHYDVFVNPKGSTAALALIFVPLWNTLVFSPVAIFVAWLFLRRRGRQVHHAP